MTDTRLERVADRLRTQPPTLYLVVGVAAFLRLYALGTESYWLDEIASVDRVRSRTLIEVIVETPFIDRHPPLYYGLLDVWTELVGISETLTRLPAAVFGIAAVCLLYAVGARLFDRRVGLVAAAMLALSRFAIGFAQDTRMYSLLACTTLLSFYWFVRLVETDSRRNAAGYLVATALLGYTHAYGFLLILAQNLYAVLAPLVDGDRSPLLGWRRWIGIQTLLAVVLSPLVYALLGQVVGAGGTPGLTWITEPTAAYVVRNFGVFFHPVTPFLGLLVVFLPGVFLLGEQAARRFGSTDGASAETAGDPNGDAEDSPVSHRWLLLVLWVLVPIVVAVGLSYLVTPIYVYRYTIGAGVGLFLLLAAAVSRIESVEFRYIALAAIFVCLLVSLPGYYSGTQHAEWRSAAHYLDRQADADDVILISDLAYRNAFGYYYTGRDASLLAVPDTTGSESLRSSVRGNETVWFVAAGMERRERNRFQRVLNRNRTRSVPREFAGRVAAPSNLFACPVSKRGMEQRWDRLEDWIETNAPAFTSNPRPPATADEIDAAEAELGVTFPPSVRQSYLVHDGEDSGAWGVLGYRLLPLSELVEKTQSLREIDEDFDYDRWDESLIPLLAVGNGDFLCVRDAPDREETTFLRWDHETSDRNELEPSFRAFFDAVLEALEAGDYEYDDELESLSVGVEIHRY